MNLAKNIIVSYFSQAYVIVVSLLVIPFYVDILGAEAYGLIGFFSMLQGLLALLDAGMSGTISREATRFKNSQNLKNEFISLYKTLCFIFLLIATFISVNIIYASSYISSEWLNIEHLERSHVIDFLNIMALCVAFRWYSFVFRGVLQGLEEINFLSYFNIVFATLRFILVIPVIISFEATLYAFFYYQALIAFLELIVLIIYAQKKVSWMDFFNCKINFYLIQKHLRFSIHLAFASGIWVLVTQVDKLLLSKLLNLKDYGYLTLAVLVGSGIMLLTNPLSISILPRLTSLWTEKKYNDFINLYRKSTRIVALISSSIGLFIVFFAKEIMFVWTGDSYLSEQTYRLLTFYSLGYLLLSFSAFPYYLQFAMGNLKLHVIGSLLFMLVLIITIFPLVNLFGSIGAAYSWCIVNVFNLFIWIPILHKKLIPGLHKKWISYDIIPSLLAGIIFLFFSKFIYNEIEAENERLVVFFSISIIFAINLAILYFIFKKKLIELSLNK